jgi:nicotinate-nucleotide pyrophosphorylase (carboxylating)
MDSIDLTLLQDSLLAMLREDIGSGDITAAATIPQNARASGQYRSKQPLVVAGIPVLQEMVKLADPQFEFKAFFIDGASVEARTAIAAIRGSARSILTVERTSLNILQHLCGIATLTRQYVERVAGTPARIIDTRKTVPGLRVLEKYAVTCGGGTNHRMGLFDGVLIKNNHQVFHSSVAGAVREARRHVGHLVKIEVEVRSLDELKVAIESGADVILLDNFNPEQTRKAVEMTRGRIPLESSGGITLETVRSFAETGVDYISVGALTHSAPAADIHLRVTSE